MLKLTVLGTIKLCCHVVVLLPFQAVAHSDDNLFLTPEHHEYSNCQHGNALLINIVEGKNQHTDTLYMYELVGHGCVINKNSQVNEHTDFNQQLIIKLCMERMPRICVLHTMSKYCY